MEFISELIFVSLVTCAISSGWLHSALLEEFRNWWLRYYSGKKLRHLAICQLCCSFWFALPVTWVVCVGISWYGIILVSLASAVVSWAMGAWVTNQLWQKAYYEKSYKYINGESIKGRL